MVKNTSYTPEKGPEYLCADCEIHYPCCIKFLHALVQ